MTRPKKDPDDKASIVVTLRLTPPQAAVLDALRGKVDRPLFVRKLIGEKYEWMKKYGGMKPVVDVKREQGGTDG